MVCDLKSTERVRHVVVLSVRVQHVSEMRVPEQRMDAVSAPHKGVQHPECNM